ncbi:MAG TPA: HDOD domain-containing protein [Candidatus Hydrogenedentes bacterium]|nr:HDOD domain-containing protein [Candidatus Hydrogenedentota bacterium]HOL77887.1 HDOD domain-containing protein [Candidatus Hydrogenedentota bacterium]HPO87052.1 HDOD domain-containing protein [Candidatus Hydrogenedentota bacterium]
MVSCIYCSTPFERVPSAPPNSAIMACKNCLNPCVLFFDGTAWKSEIPRGWQDLRTVSANESIGLQVLSAALKASEQLPVLPAVAHRIMEMVRDPDVVIGDITELIRTDAVIAMKILRLANSPLYAGLSEIKDLHAACVRLGMKTVAGVVHAIANGRLYVTRDPHYQEMMQTLWQHALATAYCASELSMMLAQPQKDVYFIAGLVHDVGKVVLLDLVSNVLPRDEAPVIRTLRQSRDLLLEVMDIYHPLIGLHVVQQWNLPSDFGIATFFHEQPDFAPNEAWLMLSHIIAFSSAVATVSGFGLKNENISLLSLPSTKFLGLSDIKIASLRVNLEDKVKTLLEVAPPSAA